MGLFKRRGIAYPEVTECNAMDSVSTVNETKDFEPQPLLPDRDVDNEEIPTIDVRDIKEYLVREFEKVKELNRTIDELNTQLEAFEELKFKYDAVLVTLDGYADKCKMHEDNLKKKNNKIKSLNEELKQTRDNLNSYKIKLNAAQLTKEDMTEEIISEFKEKLIKDVFGLHKGNLSKKLACEMIEGAE